jgi:squalene synthase HpnC
VSLIADAPSGASAIHVSGGAPSASSPQAHPPPAALPPPAAIRARSRTENFPVASRLLGRRARADLFAIYDFARLVDELGDSAEGDRLAALDWAEGELDRALQGAAEHPVFTALQPAIRSRALPRGPFARLIEANRVDQRVSRYRTWDELRGYCRLSADPVGELVLGVFGAADPPRIALSDSICTGLQLTEHLQDVVEDHARGRIYMPLEDLERFGVGEADLLAAGASPALDALVAFELERARSLLRAGVPLVDEVPRRAGLAVAGFIAGGLAALAAIERAGHDVSSGPPHAGRALFARCMAQTLSRARRERRERRYGGRASGGRRGARGVR